MIRTLKKLLLVFIFLLPIDEKLWAQDTLYLTKAEDLPARSADYVLFGFPGDVSLQLATATSFKLPPNADSVRGKFTSTYWIRFIVKNDYNETRSEILELQNPWTNHVETWELSIDSIRKFNPTGIDYLFDTRPIWHKNIVFQTSFKPKETKIFYVKIRSTSFNTFVLRFRSVPYFIWYAITEYYLLGIFYGILLLVFIYNALLYISLKEKVYLFYLLYLFACGLYTMGEDGTGFQYIYPDLPAVNSYISYLTQIVFIGSFALYSSAFLQLSKQKQWILAILCALYFCFYNLESLEIIKVDIGYGISAIVFTYIFIMGIQKAFVYKYKPAYYFLIAYGFVIVGVMFNLMRNAGIRIGSTYFSAYGLNLGFLIEVIVLSIALSERLRLEKTEKEKSRELLIEKLQENEKLKDILNKELEAKVEERTKELQISNRQLEDAYIQLQSQAEEIERMNQLLAEDNKVLQEDVKEQTKARAMSKDLSFEEFNKIYPDEESCLKYISEIKWVGEFHCKRCNNTKHFAGRAPYSRRCTQCGYEESATNATIFHRCKIPLEKAFYMVYLVGSRRDDITSEQLSHILQIRQKTCWSFKQKIMLASQLPPKSGKKKGRKDWDALILTSLKQEDEED